MKKIGPEQINYVAHLARVRLGKEEAEKFSQQLGDVLAYAEKLDRLEAENVEPTSHVFPLKNVFREDEVKDSLPGEKALANAPDREAGSFRVPRVIE